tara:strand:- start:764 stop:1291 length:528 start_codon:yes stop_codon:yes gene_type:complete
MLKKYKKNNESLLSNEHKTLLKTFLKDLINDLGNGKLDRDNLVLRVNQIFNNNNLKPIYTKIKLSNSIANYRYKEKYLKKRNLNIKIPERILNKKVVKKAFKKEPVKEEPVKEEPVKKAFKKEPVKEEPKTSVPDDKASVNISHIEFYIGLDIPHILFQEVIKCEELPVFESNIF